MDNNKKKCIYRWRKFAAMASNKLRLSFSIWRKYSVWSNALQNLGLYIFKYFKSLMLLIDAECIGADLIQSQVKSSQTMGAHDYIIMILLMLSFLLWFDVNTALIFEHNYEVDSWGSQLSLLFCSCYYFCWMTTQLWSSSTIMKSTHGAQCTAAPAVGYKWCKYHFKAGLYYKVTTETRL